jgi:hypothetical protein
MTSCLCQGRRPARRRTGAPRGTNPRRYNRAHSTKQRRVSTVHDFFGSGKNYGSSRSIIAWPPLTRSWRSGGGASSRPKTEGDRAYSFATKRRERSAGLFHTRVLPPSFRRIGSVLFSRNLFANAFFFRGRRTKHPVVDADARPSLRASPSSAAAFVSPLDFIEKSKVRGRPACEKGMA